jgi:hypothetical protein
MRGGLDAAAAPARSPAVCFDAPGGITLHIAERGHDEAEYPSSMIRKGLTMSLDGVDLCEEGVGFGVPVLKQARETIFPGTLHVRAEASAAVAEYDMDLVERLTLPAPRSFVSVALNAMREPLALLHRRYPVLRRALTGISNAMRSAFGIRTTFEHARSLGTIRVTYRFNASAGEVTVSVEVHGLAAEGCTELVLMNEQGARFFDRYEDSTGCERRGDAIETWQEVSARQAAFHDSRHGVSFALNGAPGARLFRGRELVGDRLAWAGLAYVLPAGTKEFSYGITLGARA